MVKLTPKLIFPLKSQNLFSYLHLRICESERAYTEDSFDPMKEKMEYTLSKRRSF